jgi:hypothetical protein
MRTAASSSAALPIEYLVLRLLIAIKWLMAAATVEGAMMREDLSGMAT